MKRQNEASDLLDTACGDFEKATTDAARSAANTDFGQAVI